MNECPSSQPTRLPTCQPSSLSCSQVTSLPTCPHLNRQRSRLRDPLVNHSKHRRNNHRDIRRGNQPTRQPSSLPSRSPTRQPSGQPRRRPSMPPTRHPSRQPNPVANRFFDPLRSLGAFPRHVQRSCLQVSSRATDFHPSQSLSIGRYTCA
jgi:hypothetical protein